MEFRDNLMMVENNGFFTNELMTVEAQKFIKEVMAMKKIVTETETKMRELLLKEMQEKKIIKVDTGDFTVIKKDGYSREKFEAKKLKEDNPDLYNKYCGFTNVKESLEIKFNG